jgi:hypothetical protein
MSIQRLASTKPIRLSNISAPFLQCTRVPDGTLVIAVSYFFPFRQIQAGLRSRQQGATGSRVFTPS